MYQVNLVKNYLTNVEEVLSLVKKYEDKFSVRTSETKHRFDTRYGESSLKSMFYYNMPDDLKEAIFRTIPDKIDDVTSFTINRYDPGDYLPRHRDSIGGYWKFKLIFLDSEQSHFQWFDENGIPHLVEEAPGAFLDMPIFLEHEVTKINNNERPKYSLVLSWGHL